MPGSPKGPKALRGLQFPIGKSNERNSTDAVKTALAASMQSVDKAAADNVFAEKNWRRAYNVHLVKNCELLSGGPPRQEVVIAGAGLEALHNSFEYIDASGSVESLANAMAHVPSLIEGHGGFDSAVVVGAAAGSPPVPLQVPLNGELLEGERLCAQLQRWVDDGIIEADAQDAIGQLAGQVAVDLSGQHFVCIGASSEMCPTSTLLALGATVYAVDVPRPKVWHQLVRTAAASRGTLVVPLRQNVAERGASVPTQWLLGDGLTEEQLCQVAGCDITIQTPEVAAWICAQAEGQRLCVGSYVYADGANFVRVALAADAILEKVCSLRPDVALAMLSSPTECYAVPDIAFADAAKKLSSPPAGKAHRIWYTALRLASGGRYCEAAAPAATVATDKGPCHLRDSYVWMQGPNYAFAKQIQRWRMLVARSRGHTVSANLGPMTLTRSILSNALIGAGVKGATHFGLQPFYAPTSSALLAALLIHDLSCKTSAANPSTPLASPILLFSENALHVGSWRAAFKTNSYTEVCALTYGVGKAQPYLIAGSVAVAGLSAWRRRAKL